MRTVAGARMPHSDICRAPGCLIPDVRMPGMSGLKLLDELRKRQSGTDEFIQKPVNDKRPPMPIMKSLRRRGVSSLPEFCRLVLVGDKTSNLPSAATATPSV